MWTTYLPHPRTADPLTFPPLVHTLLMCAVLVPRVSPRCCAVAAAASKSPLVENRIDSPEMNVQYRMSVQEYEELTPYAGDLVENWGKAPGHLNSDGQNLLVFGAKFGNVFIGVQPTFGYEVNKNKCFFLLL